MKKTNIRIRRNGGSKAVSPQVPNKPEPAKGKAQSQRYQGKVNIDTWDPKGVALVLMSGGEAGPEEEIAGLNYSAAEFAEIQRTATNSKQTLGELLKSAIDARLIRYKTVQELEEATDQAHALSVLLQHQMFYPEDGVVPGEGIKNGIVHLANHTFGRLRAAVAAVENPATGEGGVQ